MFILDRAPDEACSCVHPFGRFWRTPGRTPRTLRLTARTGTDRLGVSQPNTGPHGICRHALYWTLVTASGAHRVEVGGVFAFPAISARRPRS